MQYGIYLLKVLEKFTILIWEVVNTGHIHIHQAVNLKSVHFAIYMLCLKFLKRRKIPNREDSSERQDRDRHRGREGESIKYSHFSFSKRKKILFSDQQHYNLKSILRD